MHKQHPYRPGQNIPRDVPWVTSTAPTLNPAVGCHLNLQRMELNNFTTKTNSTHAPLLPATLSSPQLKSSGSMLGLSSLRCRRRKIKVESNGLSARRSLATCSYECQARAPRRAHQSTQDKTGASSKSLYQAGKKRQSPSKGFAVASINGVEARLTGK